MGINKILHPHLTVVDGIVALGRFPIKLKPNYGWNRPFAVDWIASKIMGYKPSRIKFLNMAYKEKMEILIVLLHAAKKLQISLRIFQKMD